MFKISQYEFSMTKYWELVNSENNDVDYEILFNQLDNAIKSQLISERPLGIYLSGGLDSSIVAAIASNHLDEVNTFHI